MTPNHQTERPSHQLFRNWLRVTWSLRSRCLDRDRISGMRRRRRRRVDDLPGDHARSEPEIDVVLVSLAWFEEGGAFMTVCKAVAEARSHPAVLNALCPAVRVDVL